ncbi:2-iminobutanoate/2-iminopropanoate deaminase [Penicillium rolfsii]|nr:2-iminobutanoate/2-iminopropanoate deaminase [Penicillium rolfsii]
MSAKQAVLTKNAPAPLPGIYSQAIVANGFVYCSGCVPMDAQSGNLIEGDIKAHTHQCIKNISHILEAAGSDITKVVKVNVFISNMDDFAEMNSVYTLYWGDVKPARTCVAVKTLPLNTDVEIECVAVL